MMRVTGPSLTALLALLINLLERQQVASGDVGEIVDGPAARPPGPGRPRSTQTDGFDDGQLLAGVDDLSVLDVNLDACKRGEDVHARKLSALSSGGSSGTGFRAVLLTLRILTPGVSQKARQTFARGARARSSDTGGTPWTRSPLPAGARWVSTRSGLSRRSLTRAWLPGSANVRLCRSVSPPCSHPSMWWMWQRAAGVEDPGAELPPSSPKSARYWARLPSRCDRPSDSVCPRGP